MQSTKGKDETFREYFLRARHDADVRREILRSATVSRSIAGWMAILFLALTLGRMVFLGLRTGAWVSNQAIATAIFFVLTMMVYAKFGHRIADLESMNPPAGGPGHDH